MTLVTLFSAPKAFTDPVTARTQCNAIESWKRLAVERVLLLGNAAGIAAAAEDMGVRHMPEVAVNRNGVPLISSMVQRVRASSDSALLAIINTDIILTSDFTRVAREMESLRSTGALNRRFVLVSRRWDLEVPTAMDFSDGWETRLRQVVREQGRLHRPTGSDFFLFPRDCYPDIPDFAVGRAGWDNWMIYKARAEGWPVIDATPSMLIVHQAHDYRHLPGAKPHYNHPDTLVNMKLAGGQAAIRYTILDATHALVDGRLVHPTLSRERLMRGVELALRRLFFFLPEHLVENLVRPKRWSKRLRKLLSKTGAGQHEA